jgi:hypothetical protein
MSQDLTDIVTMMLKVDANHDPSEANDLLSAGAREITRLRTAPMAVRPQRTWAQCYGAGIGADLEKKPRVPPADYTEYEQACWFAGYDR